MSKDKSGLKIGDRVIVYGLPYAKETTQAVIVTKTYGSKDNAEDRVVGVRYNHYGKSYAVVNTDRVLKRRSINMKLSKQAIATLVIAVFVAFIGLWTAGNYNSLVHSHNAVSNSKAKIDTQLTRRYELIDNIVASVKGSQAQESDVFGKIAAARKIGGNTTDPNAQAAANQTIDTQIALLPRLQEAYPDLKSNDQVSKLIAELQGTANSVREARDTYNDTVTNYNNNISSFPKSVFAGIFHYENAKLFQASAQEQVNPTVDFTKNN